MTDSATMVGERATRARYFILLMLFIATTINYADRATLSIAGTPLAKDLHVDPAAMGYLFSAFSWSYVIGQLPGGWLLDRYGSKLVYGLSIFIWSIFTFAQGWSGFFAGGAAIATIFTLRFRVGFAEAPAFPANARLVAAWFPNHERGTASAIFNSAQYFAAFLFTPIMAWITTQFGWEYVFFFMGAFGIRRHGRMGPNDLRSQGPPENLCRRTRPAHAWRRPR
jgi:ACS family glucarate transporter-like MFS transporter